MEMWNWPCSSSSPSISNRLQDILERIRGKIVKAVTGAVRKSFEELGKEIQNLSLDMRRNTPEELKRLMAEVEKAERLGFDVKEYKERLAELESILDVLRETKDWVMKLRSGVIHARLEIERLEAEEERERKALRECASNFQNIASAPLGIAKMIQ